MASRNRGRKKPKLRDLSRETPTLSERAALRDALGDAAPITTAILGAVMVEHELEALLRLRLPRKDDETWMELTSERGPLSSFSEKIITAYALRICDEDIRANLDIVRIVRNAFAHSKKLIDFDHPLVIAELDDVRIAKTNRRDFKLVRKRPFGARQAYVSLCFTLTIFLLQKQVRAGRRRRASTPFGGLLGALNPGSVQRLTRPESPGLFSLAALAGQTGNPKSSTRERLIAALLQQPAKSDRSTDK